MYSIEERLARAEVKLERMEKLEEQLKRTQHALIKATNTYDRNFDILSGRVRRKSDGFFADLFNW